MVKRFLQLSYSTVKNSRTSAGFRWLEPGVESPRTSPHAGHSRESPRRSAADSPFPPPQRRNFAPSLDILVPRRRSLARV